MGVYGILQAAASMILLLLCDGTPIRGGIDIGIGREDLSRALRVEAYYVGMMDKTLISSLSSEQELVEVTSWWGQLS